MTTLSVIIICKNEENNIGGCLDSVKFADEIIVLDSNSTDRSQEIARIYTKKVFVTDWPGFGKQKTRALNKASSQWILSIDADERVTEKLRKEILTVIHTKQSINAFKIRRLSSYCGRIMYHGDWKNDYVIRLFKRTAGKFSDDIVHEKFIPNDKYAVVGKMKSTLLHYSYKSFEDVLNKVNTYSSLSAQKKAREGKKSSVKKALFRAFWSFFRGYIIRGGFLDGCEGFLLAASNAECVFYRYVKLSYYKKLH